MTLAKQLPSWALYSLQTFIMKTSKIKLCILFAVTLGTALIPCTQLMGARSRKSTKLTENNLQQQNLVIATDQQQVQNSVIEQPAPETTQQKNVIDNTEDQNNSNDPTGTSTPDSQVQHPLPQGTSGQPMPEIVPLQNEGNPTGTEAEGNTNNLQQSENTEQFPDQNDDKQPAVLNVIDDSGQTNDIQPGEENDQLESQSFVARAIQLQEDQQEEEQPQGDQQDQGGEEQAEPVAQTVEEPTPQVAAPASLPNEYRDDIFEQVSVLRQNVRALQNIARNIGATDTYSVMLNAGYLNHKQSIARGLGYNADTFMITGIASSAAIGTPNGGVCSLALAVAYADTLAKYKGSYSASGNKFKEKTFLVGPCATYKSGALEIDASLMYGHTKYRSSRLLPIGNNVRMNTSGNSLHGQVVASYTIPYSGLIIQPQVGINYDHVTQKGHQFRNNGAVLDVKNRKLDFLSAFAGVRIDMLTFSEEEMKPYVFIGFAQDIRRHNNVAKKANITGGQNAGPVDVISYPGSRGHLMTSVGVEFQLFDNAGIDVSYHGNFNGKRKTHAILYGLDYNF